MARKLVKSKKSDVVKKHLARALKLGFAKKGDSDKLHEHGIDKMLSQDRYNKEAAAKKSKSLLGKK